MRIPDKRALSHLQRALIFAAARCDAGQIIEGHALLLRRPRGLIEGIVRLLFLPLQEQT